MSADADTRAMLRLQQGDDLALNELMDRWQKPLVAYFYRHFGNLEEALDLAQETFVRIYENRTRYKPTGRYSAWIFTIAGNLCRNFARWQSRHPTIPIQPGEGVSEYLEDLPSEQKTPFDTAESSELAAAVRAQVLSLPLDLRTVVLLFEYEELSYQEIAQITGASAKAVEMRLYRARKVLREKLGDFVAAR
jgi:RNA polymerase sigma-70 factor (ECF subfamily)